MRYALSIMHYAVRHAACVIPLIRNAAIFLVLFLLSLPQNNQIINQPASQPSNQPTNQPSCQPAKQPNNQPSNQSTNHPNSQPASHPTNQLNIQPTSALGWKHGKTCP